MKRSEMKVGETYAVMAPSQKVGGWKSAKKATVVATEPVYRSSYRSWSSSETPATVVIDGETFAIDDDQTYKVGEKDHDYNGEAKRSVLVMVEDERRRWTRDGYQDPSVYRTLQVVPLSQVRMLWEDYEAESDEARAQKERAWKAHERAQKERARKTAEATARRDALNEVLAGTDLQAKVVDSEVVLSGPYEVLVAIVETANDQAFRAVTV